MKEDYRLPMDKITLFAFVTGISPFPLPKSFFSLGASKGLPLLTRRGRWVKPIIIVAKKQGNQFLLFLFNAVRR